MSFESVRIGASGLSAAQRGVDVAGHNTANAATTGYTRQRVELVNATPSNGIRGMVGTGVAIGSLDRMRDAFSDSAYRSAAGQGGAATATHEILTRVQSLLGSIDGGLPASLNSFYDAASTLSLRPNDTAARQSFLGQTTALARSFSDLAIGIDAVGPDVVGKAIDVVSEVNTLSAHVAKLNTEIADATVSGQVPADLLDSRDRSLDRLSELTGARVGTPDAQGRVAVYIGGQPLVRDTSSYPLRASATPNGAAVAFADGQPAPVTAGTLGGLLAASQTLGTLRADLDKLAVDVMGQVNSIHAGGYDLNGNTGRDLFSGTSAATMRVDPTMTAANVAASSTGAVNDGNNALAMSAARSAQAADGSTAAGRLGGWVATVGLATADAKLRSQTTTSVQVDLDAARISKHAVSVDEEMVDMIRFQRAYQAAARVVSIADAMLDTLINRTGA